MKNDEENLNQKVREYQRMKQENEKAAEIIFELERQT